ncbi:hypothetical protein DSM104443_00785 [Usitatibacter rugosus]|uniref:Uncharacterized protein n=1 Tax=Usitatibacter rugosus TaxID=2732067 RepID=A0A6M4GRP5_9PROT|nr:Ig-like domain-containing protein [Usitatibacter rugosus]QJR09735.1 hypothetical protein DSM104443_00785 [Usitatibacter rugosus]
MTCIQRLVATFVALALLLAASASQASLWFGDDHGLHRVDPTTNVALSHIATAEPVAVAIDPMTGAVWSVTRTRVTRHTQDGTQVFSRTLASYADNIGNGRRIAVNAEDGSAWVGSDRRLLHLARDGSLFSSVPGEVTDLAIAPDDSAWVLDTDRDELRHYDSLGALLTRTALGGASRRALSLALDSSRGYLWLGGDDALVQRSLANPSQVLRTIDTPHEVNAFSLDEKTGELWVLGDNSFHGYRANGTRFESENLGNDGVVDPRALAFDPDTQALWIGHRRGVTRFSRNGQRLATVPADHAGAIAVSRAALYFTPAIHGVSPNGPITKTQSPIVFRYDALCSGSSCGFPPEFFASYSIIATLDGASIGPFTFDPVSGETRHTPATPLSQGPHTVRAQAVDADGRISQPAELTFTLDSEGPSLTALSPPSGATFTTQPITVMGAFDPSAVLVGMSNLSPIPGNAFSFQVPLEIGAREYRLGAIDALGNQTTIFLTYTYDPPNAKPTVSIWTPFEGQVFSPGPASFDIGADAADSDGTVVSVEFFLDGVSVGISTAQFPSVSLTDVPAGLHTLTARATDNRGGVGLSAPVQVRVNATPTVSIVEPANGATVGQSFPLRALLWDDDDDLLYVELLVNGESVALYFGSPPELEISAFIDGVGVHTVALRVMDSRFVITTSESIQVTVVP